MILKKGYSLKVKNELKEKSGQDVSGCLQCAKCSAGCPVIAAMDLLPHQVMRLLQLGEIEELIESKTPWVCASCFTCNARCPRDLDLSRVMEGVRLIYLRKRGSEGLSPSLLTLKDNAGLPQQALVSIFRKLARN